MNRLACVAVCAVALWSLECQAADLKASVKYHLWLNDGAWFKQNQAFTSHEAAMDFWWCVRRGIFHADRKISDYRVVASHLENSVTDAEDSSDQEEKKAVDLSGWWVAYDTKEGEPPAVVSVTKDGDEVYTILWMRNKTLIRGAITTKGNVCAVLWIEAEKRLSLQVYEIKGGVIVGPTETWRRLKLPIGDV